MKRQRRDFHHKTALWLVRRYDIIYLEDLKVANLVQNCRLAKSISDAGWAQFRSILEGNAAYAGRRVVAVPPAYTSQDCSGCGERVEKSLSIRICPSCGLILDRDENAARNIQRAGPSGSDNVGCRDELRISHIHAVGMSSIPCLICCLLRSCAAIT